MPLERRPVCSDGRRQPPRADLDDRQRALRARAHAAGQRVSTRAPRLAIGGGHPNDINSWVAEWKELHEARRRQLAELAAPPETARGEIMALLEPMVGVFARTDEKVHLKSVNGA